MLDTGCCVTVILESFVNENLPQATLQTIERILNIECADESQLLYLGYIEADKKHCWTLEAASVSFQNRL